MARSAATGVAGVVAIVASSSGSTMRAAASNSQCGTAVHRMSEPPNWPKMPLMRAAGYRVSSGTKAHPARMQPSMQASIRGALWP